MNPVKWFRGKFGRHVQEASRAGQTDVDRVHSIFGLGADWALAEYGEYYATSVPVYTAVNIRGNSMGFVPWKVFKKDRRTGKRVEVRDGDQVHDLLANPNPHFTPFELRRALEINLSLWGRAFLSIERSEAVDDDCPELWPLRPDRLLTVPGLGRHGPYVRGYIYLGANGKEVAYLPEEVEAFYNYNPLRDRTGISPVAPVRLSVDMGKDGLRYNRETFRVGAVPDTVIAVDGVLTDSQVQEFYSRWEARYQGATGQRRPALMSNVREVKPLGFNNRDLEFNRLLTWTLADAGRVWGVPVTMMNDLTNATLANMESQERAFWRNTMFPQARFYEGRWNSSLLPKLGFRGYELEHDFSVVSVLGVAEDTRNTRDQIFLQNDVVTINEVRRDHGMDDVSWGNRPLSQTVQPSDAGGAPVRNPQEFRISDYENGHGLSEELATLLADG